MHIQLIGITERVSSDYKIWRFPYAYPVILAQLRKTQHTFNVIDAHLHKKTRHEILSEINTSDVKVFGISAYSSGYKFTRRIVEAIKEKDKSAIVIVGGILGKQDDLLMQTTDADIVVHATEGEFVLPLILDALDGEGDLSIVPGITAKVNGNILKTKAKPLMSKAEYHNIDRPAYEFFDEQIKELVYNINTRETMPVKGFPILVSRGCPYNCSFCSRIYDGHFLRKSWKEIFDELDFLLTKYKVQGFWSLDTNTFLNENDVDEYCNEYRKRGYTFKLAGQWRPNFGNFEMFKKLVDHGVIVSTFGFESGSNRILKVMNKKITTDEMIRVAKGAIDAGMIITGNFVFGMPGENCRTVKKTRKFMCLLESVYATKKRIFDKQGMKSYKVDYNILKPLPPSWAFDYGIEKGKIKDVGQYLDSLDANDFSDIYNQNIDPIKYSGGNSNLSDFPTEKALKYYVMFSMDIVKLLSELRQRPIKIIDSLNVVKSAIQNYLKFIFHALFLL